jgi:hypothetical protein
MFYFTITLAALLIAEVAAMAMMVRSTRTQAQRRGGMATILTVCALATFVGVWLSTMRGNTYYEDALGPFIWFGGVNAVGLVVYVIALVKYGKPRSSS